MDEYRKSFEDEIDWKIIDQLHTVTNRFSSTSLELKKIYFVLLGITIPVVFKISGETFDISLLISPLLMTLVFWFADSLTYYYQEKLRERMDKHFEELKKRNSKLSEIINPESDNQAGEEFTLENSRTANNRICRSAFNYSTSIYPLLFLLIVILIGCHYKGWF